jgi:hypothetical protein
MTVRTRESWPAALPRKGTKARETLLLCLRGARSKDLLERYLANDLSAWRGYMLNEKGVEIRRVGNIYLIVGFMRRNGRYRQAPGSLKRIEHILSLKNKAA